MANNKIIMLLDSSDFGGIESHVIQLSKGLERSGFDVAVCLLKRYGKHPIESELVKANIRLIQLNGRFAALLQLIQSDKPALVHTHGYKAGVLGRVACLIAGTSTVSTFHAGERLSGRLKLYDTLDRWSSCLSKANFAVSEQIAARVPYSTSVLDNFIDTASLSQSSGKQIAFVGRLSHEKGPDRLLTLARAFPDVALHCYGDGPLKEQLQLSSEQAGIENLVLHGQQQDMGAIWSRIGLLLMPSRNEGMPMAALEAMGRGIPIIASDVGALAKLIHHQNNGWLIPQNHNEGFINALRQWQRFSASRKRRMQELAQATIREHFSTESVLPKLIKSYGLEPDA